MTIMIYDIIHNEAWGDVCNVNSTIIFIRKDDGPLWQVSGAGSFLEIKWAYEPNWFL